MNMEGQEDLESRMLSQEDARGGGYAGDLHFRRGMSRASSSSWRQDEDCRGYAIGDGTSSLVGGLSPLPSSQRPPATQPGSSSLSFEESRVRQIEERVLPESTFDRFQDFNLGSDPRVPNPSGIAPAFPSSFMQSSAGPSLSQSSRAQPGYTAYGDYVLPNNLLSDGDETTSLSTLQQPWPANSSYGATESDCDNGVLGRHSQNRQSLGGGSASSTNPPWSIYTAGLNSRNNDGQQVRSLRNREALGSEQQSIIGHDSMSYPCNESLNPRNHDEAWRSAVSCGKDCLFEKAINKSDSPTLISDLSHVTAVHDCAIHHCIRLMTDQAGSRLIQMLFEVCGQTQLMEVILALTEKSDVLLKICRHRHGTLSLQKLIKCIKTRDLSATLIEALRPAIIVLMKNRKGKYVIIQCLKSFTHKDIEYFFEPAREHCLDLATNRNSCVVLQQYISKTTVAHKRKLLAEISAHAYEIAQDRYGNYVIQEILNLEIPSENRALASKFKGKYAQLSTDNYGTFVVQKCLKKFDEADQATIFLELISFPGLDQFVKHEKANYVIHAALMYAKNSELYEMLKGAVLRHRHRPKNNPYCR